MTTITATSIATGFDRKWDDEAHRSVRTPITHDVNRTNAYHHRRNVR